MASDATLHSGHAWCNAWVIDENPTLVLGLNPSRVRYVIQNTSGVMYIKLGLGCTPYNYTYRLPQSAVLEDFYQGAITACVMSDTGICMVTEEV